MGFSGTDVVAGKSLSPRTYVEVSTSLRTGQGGFSTEYELRPNIRVETDSGPNLRPGIGVHWKKDY